MITWGERIGKAAMSTSIAAGWITVLPWDESSDLFHSCSTFPTRHRFSEGPVSCKSRLERRSFSSWTGRTHSASDLIFLEPWFFPRDFLKVSSAPSGTSLGVPQAWLYNSWRSFTIALSTFLTKDTESWSSAQIAVTGIGLLLSYLKDRRTKAFLSWRAPKEKRKERQIWSHPLFTRRAFFIICFKARPQKTAEKPANISRYSLFIVCILSWIGAVRANWRADDQNLTGDQALHSTAAVAVRMPFFFTACACR